MRAHGGSRWRALLILGIPLGCLGCLPPGNTYVVEITPRDSGLERRVTIYRTVGPDSARQVAPALKGIEAARLMRAYGVRIDTLATLASLNERPPWVARGKFANIPDDLGNWGSLHGSRSLLGTTWTYAERIRGDTDPVATMSAQLDAADSVADVVEGWAAYELQRRPHWDRLYEYLAGDLRRQLHEVALACWLAGAVGDSSALARVLVGLEEHAAVRDLFTFAGIYDSEDHSLPRDAAIADLRARFARVMEIRSAAEEQRTLAFLANSDSADRSLARYLTGESAASGPEARELWNAQVLRMVGDILSATADWIEVRLAAPTRPFMTNGVWDAARGRLTWAGGIPEDPPALPLACFAQWSVPDSVRQRRLFGSTLLADNDLDIYCRWFAALPAARQREWDRMLTGLKPGDLRPVERFRFADETAGRGAARDSTSASLADLPRQLIQAAAGRRK